VVSLNIATQAPGWFGKLSCLGDFASRRLTPEWLSGCDDWLSRCISYSQAQLGAQWLPTYLAAPVWRFAWGPNVADEQWWFGILMPSCDSVGRYFPLVLAQPRAMPPDDRFAFAHLELWWSQLAQAALATLADAASVERFEAALLEAPPWPAVRANSLRSQAVPGARRWQLPAGVGLGELAQALAAESLHERLLGQTLWWPWRPDGQPGQDGQEGQCTLAPGLPTPELFNEMLLG
jgi:type VI secretion system protein ImpM